jgi:uncharacterized iron-regulated membrane protein
MAPAKKTTTRKKKKTVRKRKTQKKYRFQLSLANIAGVGVVVFCLFLWMFLLGIWAGQTILFPVPPAGKAKVRHAAPAGQPIQILRPDGKKKPVK